MIYQNSEIISECSTFMIDKSLKAYLTLSVTSDTCWIAFFCKIYTTEDVIDWQGPLRVHR